MFKNSRFGGPFEKQHDKSARGLYKSASHHVYHIHWSLRSPLSQKKCLLLTWKILGLLLNTLGAGEKYPVFNRDNLTIAIQMILSQKKIFSAFFALFFKSRLNFEHFEKKDDPHSFCISEITDCENVVRKSRFRGCFDKQYGKRWKKLFKSSSHHLYDIHWSLPRNFSWKKSLLLTYKTLGLLVNTLAADEKYRVLNTENLTIPIQMQLSQKQKTFLSFLLHFLNLA